MVFDRIEHLEDGRVGEADIIGVRQFAERLNLAHSLELLKEGAIHGPDLHSFLKDAPHILQVDGALNFTFLDHADNHQLVIF